MNKKKLLSLFLAILLIVQSFVGVFAETVTPQVITLPTVVESTEATTDQAQPVDNSERDFYERQAIEEAEKQKKLEESQLKVDLPQATGDIQLRSMPGAEQTVTFTESTSATGSKSVTISDLLTINSVTVNTGKVTHSVSGKTVTVNVSGGTPRVQTGATKVVTKTVESDTNSFSSTYSYNEGGYTGNISKSGSSSSYVKTAAASKTATATHDNTITSTGTYSPSKTTSSSQNSPAPSSKSYNSGGYVGTLSRTSTTTTLSDVTTKTGTNTWKRVAKYRANYSGTVTKPAVYGYRQNYSGTVTGASTNYYSYVVTISYTAKPLSPSVTMTSPKNGEKYASDSEIPIKANGSNNHHLNAFSGTTAILTTSYSNTYSNYYAPPSAGSYTFSVKGRNTANATDPGSELAVSNEATVQVIRVGTPSVSLEQGTPVAGTSYGIKTSSSNCHHIALYVNDVFIKTTDGNNVVFDYTFPSAGTYKIELRARNADSDVIGSTAINTKDQTLTVVSPAAPSIQSTSPADGYRMEKNTAVTLSSTAVDTKYMEIFVDNSLFATSASSSISKSYTPATAKMVKVEFVAHNMADTGAAGHKAVSKTLYLNVVNQLDDYPNTVDTAYTITMQPGVVYQQSGNIEIASDEDAFKFVAKNSGNYTFTSSDDVNIRFYEVKSGGGSVPYFAPQSFQSTEVVEPSPQTAEENILLFDTANEATAINKEAVETQDQVQLRAASTGFTTVKDLNIGQTYAFVVYSEAGRAVNYTITLQPALSAEEQEKLQLIGRMRTILSNDPIAGYTIKTGEANLDTAVTTFLSWHEDKYRGQHVKGVYKILSTSWRLDVLKHWISLHESGASQAEFASARLPESYFNNIPNVPLTSAFSTGGLGAITRFNKQTATDAIQYFRNFYFPYYAFNEQYVYNATSTELTALVEARYSLWSRVVYGPDDNEIKLERIGGALYGLVPGFYQGACDFISAIYSSPKCVAELGKVSLALATGEIEDVDIYNALGASLRAFYDAYDDAEPGQQGFIIGSLVGRMITNIALGEGLVQAIKSSSLTTKLVQGATLIGSNLKVVKVALLTKADDIFNFTKRILVSEDGCLRFYTSTDEIVDVPTDLLKNELTQSGLSEANAIETIDMLKKATTEDIASAMDKAMDNARANGVTDNMAIIRVGDAVAEAVELGNVLKYASRFDEALLAIESASIKGAPDNEIYTLLENAVANKSWTVSEARQLQAKIAEKGEWIGKYYNSDMSPNWPPNDGFSGSLYTQRMEQGMKFDRYGYPTGRFGSPVDTHYDARALLPGTRETAPYSVYEVIQSFDMQAGEIAPWFGKPGGGIQYVLKDGRTFQDLLDTGIIRRVN